MPSIPANDSTYSIDDIRALVPPLKEEFVKTFGDGALEKNYFEELNEEVLRDLPYNRDASLGLIAYFMAAALQKPEGFREKLFQHFTEMAAQSSGGNKDGKRGHFSVGTQIQIVDAIDAKIEQGLYVNPEPDFKGDESKLEPFAA